VLEPISETSHGKFGAMESVQSNWIVKIHLEALESDTSVMRFKLRSNLLTAISVRVLLLIGGCHIRHNFRLLKAVPRRDKA
jgi:hypothetical protein